LTTDSERVRTQARGPEGSAYEEETKERPRSLKRRVKKAVTAFLVRVAVWIVPHLYVAYCKFVWKTSRIDDRLTETLQAAGARHDGFIALLWHQEVFTVAYGYGHLPPTTLASTGDFGLLITRMLELCGGHVFRGGSSRGRSRSRRVLLDMIRHMQQNPQVFYGITVDGSHGPAFEMKKGGPVIAKTCKVPAYAVRCWYSNRIEMPTWDRTAFPLPFGRIRMTAIGPYWIDPKATEPEFKRACAHLQNELLELTHQTHRELCPTQPPLEGFPEDFTPRWHPGTPGLKHTPWDLSTDTWPEWARMVPPASDEAAAP